MWRRAASRCAAGAVGGSFAFGVSSGGDVKAGTSMQSEYKSERAQWEKVWDFAAVGHVEPHLSNDDTWHSATLWEKRKLADDCWLYNFLLRSEQTPNGIKPSCCCLFRGWDEEGNEVIRPYTPINTEFEKGFLHFCIRDIPGGKMTRHLKTLMMYDRMDMKGPYMKFPWEPNKYKHIGMIAGGTGITPFYQILHHSIMLEDDATEFSIIFANDRIGSIPLWWELQQILDRHLQRIHCYFVVKDCLGDQPDPKSVLSPNTASGRSSVGNQAANFGIGAGPQQFFSSNWRGGIGYVNKEMIKSWMPKPGKGPILVSGPPGFMKHVSGELDYSSTPAVQGELTGLLKEAGYSAEDVYKF